MVDFGLVCLEEEADEGTLSGFPVGSPPYIPPSRLPVATERRDRRRILARRDVVRDARRSAAVSRDFAGGNPPISPRRRPQAAPDAPSGPAAQLRDALPQLPHQRPYPTLRFGPWFGLVSSVIFLSTVSYSLIVSSVFTFSDALGEKSPRSIFELLMFTIAAYAAVISALAVFAAQAEATSRAERF